MSDSTERAVIVAWLRKNVDACNVLADRMHREGSFVDSREMRDVGRSQAGIADAIERGEHIKGG